MNGNSARLLRSAAGQYIVLANINLRRSGLGIIICLGLQSVLVANDLPFTIDNPNGEWKTYPINRNLPENIRVDAIAVNIPAKARFVVMSSAKNADASTADPLAFAGRIRDLFSNTSPAAGRDRDETQMGFPGHVTEFGITIAAKIYRCALFTFTSGKTSWGVMYAQTDDQPAFPKSPFGILRTAGPVPPDVVGMSAYRIRENPVTGFPISLEFDGDATNRRVAKIVVVEVPPYSKTDREGVEVGDEVIAVDGRKAQDFPLGVTKNSELGKVFLNREPGDQVRLEIVSPKSGKSRLVTLTVPRVTWDRH